MHLRARARRAPPHPDHWYPACLGRELCAGQVRRVEFWGRGFAVFRDEGGRARVLADRCAHRPVPLSMGCVEAGELTCPYHGWRYDGAGRLRGVGHSLFGKRLPQLQVPSFVCVERCGVVWFCPGDAEQAGAIPGGPHLDPGPEGWSTLSMSAEWRAHHSAVIDNVLDLSHEHLHRRFAPFAGVELEQLDVGERHVHARYRAEVGAYRWIAPLLPQIDLTSMIMRYDYPHHGAHIGEVIRNHLFVRPLGPDATAVYVVFAAREATLPGTRRRLPRPAMALVLRALRRFYLAPLLEQDRAVLEAEHAHDDGAPSPELNPAVRAVHALTVRAAPRDELRCPGSAAA